MRRLLTGFFACVLCLPAWLPAHGATLSGDVFVVDPGHGTRYPDGSALNVGAVGPSGVAEQTVVLDVGEDLASRLRGAGAKVVLTRSHAHQYREGTDKAKDNRARAALANKLNATAFIALHADGSTDPSQRGASVFWLRNNSQALAKAIRKRLRPLGLGESQFHRRDLAVTSEAHVPAVLVELGFVSNPSQAKQLASPAFQQRLAAALFAAIQETFGAPS